MPNLNTAQFTLTYGTVKRSLGDRLEDKWITVKDFGAVGDGVADDTAAIQAAIDYAYGPFEDPNGPNGGPLLNKNIFFPAGLYKISAPLVLNYVYSPWLRGAGSHQSRIFWDSEAEQYESDNKVGFYPVIELLSCYHQVIEGLTLDASNVQRHVMHNCHSPLQADDGHEGHYRDVHITGAAAVPGTPDGHLELSGGGYGVVFTGVAMGSERLWINCKFTNCAEQGYRVDTGNALNHWFYNCYFANNRWGLFHLGQGGSIHMQGCRFENNSECDVKTQAGATNLTGCHSTSASFAVCDGMVVGCTHVNGTEGLFYENKNGGTVKPWSTADAKTAMLMGNHSTNGIVWSGAPGGYLGGTLNMMGNQFDNEGYMDDMLAPNENWVILDGVKISPTP